MSHKDALESKLPRRFFVRIFLAGGLLLVVPLIIVVFTESICSGGASGCLGSSVKRIIDTISPYPMLAGGLLIGYGMKKLADSSEESEDSPSRSYREF